MTDPFDLDRFVAAQEPIFAQALAELRRGAKRGHWMWFVFPQLAGLGASPTAIRFALSGRAEALAYRAHPVLGARLREAIAALLAAPGDDPAAILGAVDAAKLRSSMTLFEAVGEASGPAQVMARFYGGARDSRTLALLAG